MMRSVSFADTNVFLYETLPGMSLDFVFLIILAIVGSVISLTRSPKEPKGRRKEPRQSHTKGQSRPVAEEWKTIEVEVKAGHFQGALSAWRAAIAKKGCITPMSTFNHVIEAFLEEEKDNLVPEIVAHMKTNRHGLCNRWVASVLLDVVARAGEPLIMEDLMMKFADVLQLKPDRCMYETLIGGFASAGMVEQVYHVIETMEATGAKVTPKALSLSVSGFLKHRMLDATLKQLHMMKDRGYHVPPFATAQTLRLAREEKRLEEIFFALEGTVALPAKVMVWLWDDLCNKEVDKAPLACRIEAWARQSGIPVHSGAFEGLLRYWVSIRDMRANDLLLEMLTRGASITEPFLVSLLERCAESKFGIFADQIASYAKKRAEESRNADGMLSRALISALVKVYVESEEGDKACNLYEQGLEQGFDSYPSVIYSSLLKFSMEGGRHELAKRLMARAPKFAVRGVTLIRQAHQDGDVDKAFEVLKMLEDSGVQAKICVYNSVLDACASAGNVERARGLMKNICERFEQPDLIIWNTLLKAYCVKGDLAGAKAVIPEMEASGAVPDSVTFNCIANAAICAGHLPEAWWSLETMEDRGIEATNYTVSILMKHMRKGKESPADVARAFVILDKSNVDIYTDQILVNMVLDVATRHKEHHHRLNDMITRLSGDPNLSVQNYANLIKACATLRRFKQCERLWDEMIRVRKFEPCKNALANMVEALVNRGRLEDAVALQRDWQHKVPLNEYVASILIKGAARSKHPETALAIYRELHSAGVEVSSSTYQSIIEAQARLGATDVVSSLMDAMRKDGVRPDENANLCILRSHCVKGELEQAAELLDSLHFPPRERGAFSGRNDPYSTVLEACVTCDRADVALRVLEMMESRSVPLPKRKLLPLVKFFSRSGKVEEASEIAKTAPERYNMPANSTMWLQVLKGYVLEKKLEKACTVFDQLKQMRMPMVEAKEAYSSLMSACVQQGNLLKALAVLDEAHGFGASQVRALPPGEWLDVVGVRELLQAIAKRQGGSAAEAVVRRHSEAGAPTTYVRMLVTRENHMDYERHRRLHSMRQWSETSN